MQIETNGITTHYELDGPADAPVVLCSHSLATDLTMWWPQVEYLARQFRVLRYDVRGHGRSDAPDGPYSLPMLVADAAALLDGLGLDRVHWLGISMGGMIGQAFALSHPQRLLSLAICDSMAEFPTAARSAWQERLELARSQGMTALEASTLERWFTPEFVGAQPAVVERIRAMIAATPVAGYTGCSEAIMQLDLLAAIEAIRTPTLVLVGELDPGTPVAASQAIHRQIAGSQLGILANARHLTNIEVAEPFNRKLGEFLRARR